MIRRMKLVLVAAVALVAAQNAWAAPGVIVSDVTDIPGAVVDEFLFPYAHVVGVAGENTILSGNNPGAESPAQAFDNDPNGSTKFLSFNGDESGVIVTFTAPTRITGIRFRYGNDAPGRDPATYTLEGATTLPNDFFLDPDLSAFPPDTPQQELIDYLTQDDASSWTLVSAGETNLVDDADTFLGVNQNRSQWQEEQPFGRPGPTFTNDNFYTSYRLLFPTLRSPTDTIMQIAEIEFQGEFIPEPTSLLLLLAGCGVSAMVRRRA